MSKKIEIKAIRPLGYGYFRKKALRVCGTEVCRLFGGLRGATECIFEITTRRPRTPDYHRFDWVDRHTYRTTDETYGVYQILPDTAKSIRRSMGSANTIYVAAYTEE